MAGQRKRRGARAGKLDHRRRVGERGEDRLRAVDLRGQAERAARRQHHVGLCAPMVMRKRCGCVAEPARLGSARGWRGRTPATSALAPPCSRKVALGAGGGLLDQPFADRQRVPSAACVGSACVVTSAWAGRRGGLLVGCCEQAGK
jgi:hypothetical protein